MKPTRKYFASVLLLALTTACFPLLLFAGCDSAPGKNDPEQKAPRKPEELKRLKERGVDLNYFAGQVEGGFEIPARWTLGITDFSGAVSDLESLSAYKPLAHLHIRRDFSDQAMATIAKVLELEYLALDEVPITDDGLAHLARIKNLKTVQLTSLPHMTDKGIDKLCDIASLQALYVNSPKAPISDAALRRLGMLKNLQLLELDTPAISDETLKLLPGLPKLCVLCITGPKITDAGVAELAKVSELETLTLADTSVSSDCLKSLSKLRKLKNLHISKAKLNDDGLKYIPDFPALEKLSLMHAGISDDGLRHLQKSKLRELSLWGNPITDKGLSFLASIKTLRWVDDTNTKTTAAGRMELKQKLPDIAIGRNKK